ncbi:MAG: bifunctional 23S rRNA (guanine(2069)-N(7))-methyltransferase RlmK/23S rRNA (guanine(2445)-N(2))-methyltransferase RlmL [Desulfobulbaceae bacterium]
MDMTKVAPPRKRKKDRQLPRFVATCGAGLEELTAGEIREHGGRNPSSVPGAVSWEGKLESAYRMCLWSRFASRILVEIARFEATDPDALYRQAGRLDWEEHFAADTPFAVFCTSSDSPITHSRYAALRVKDAIVDQFRSRTGRRPVTGPDTARIRVSVHLRGSEAVLALDLSGESLHRRGYRVKGGEAPLKETLAAGIVRLAGFDRGFPPDAVLLDPMCGSGTLLIEAAMLFGDTAPGLQRKSFGFMAWNRHDPVLWDRLVSEAVAREEEGLERPWPRIIGWDADPAAVSAARKNIEAAGLEDRIEVVQRQLAFLTRPAEQGLLLVNPPYGERLEDKEAVRYLYRFLGRKGGEQLHGWRIGLFTANPDLTGGVNIPWEESFKLFNGPIRCALQRGKIPRSEPAPLSVPSPVRPAELSEGEDLANRLLKKCSSLLPWAEKEGITCFRLYDADIPEYNFCVDIYEKWVHVQEYAPPSTIDPEKARRRFRTGLRVIREVLQVPPGRVFIKTRRRQKGKDQYQKRPRSGKLYEVREGGCRFLVNFTDYLDTGLFLDHRTTRAMIGRLAEGKTFLNLFGYTGTATVHALVNRAVATTTVDASAVYLRRARANFALNGFGGPQHRTVQQDCLQWLRKSRERFGLIFVDPPTFSNDRHAGTTFSVQKDHEELLRLAMRNLSRDGLLIFSTNFRSFRLAEGLAADFDLREITEQTIPEDFRGTRIHRCWEFRHRKGKE